MEFTDWMLWKLIAMCVLAFAYNFWKELKYPKDQQVQRDKSMAKRD